MNLRKIIKVVLFLIVIPVLDVLLLKGYFKEWLQTPDLWLLLYIPIPMLAAGVLIKAAANKIVKSTGWILVILPICYCICLFCSPYFQEFLYEGTGLCLPDGLHDIGLLQWIKTIVVDLILIRLVFYPVKPILGIPVTI